jgi:hypothetical protein
MGKQIVNMDRNELAEECRARGINAEETASRADLLLRVQTYDEGIRAADLPAPGYKRDDVLARRKDELEQRAEEGPEVYGIDPAKIEPDREILYRSIDQQMIHVSNRDPNYKYAWVYYGQNGQMIWAKRALGWMPVTGPDPECEEYKEADGTRRIGDTMLMKIPKERYLELEEMNEKRRNEQYLGIKARLHELSEKSGIKVYDDLSEVTIGGRDLESVMERKAAQREVAMQHIDKKLRDGDVPGIPSPKKD